MAAKFDFSTPLPNRQTSLRSFSSFHNQTQKSISHRQNAIQQLYSKFMTLNSNVHVDHDISSFNMVEYEKGDRKAQYDQQLILAKLKRLENNVEMKRADMELEHRKKKIFKRKKSDESILNQKDHYLNTFKKLQEDKSQELEPYEEENKSDSDDDSAHTGTVEKLKGINYFNELRKHPKILKYTIDKVKEKETIDLEEKTTRINKLQTFKNEIKSIGHATIMSARGKQSSENPEQVFDSIFRKLYTKKKNKDKSAAEARNDSRLSRFIGKQDQILDTIEQRSLSKDNSKKLKERLNEIATQLYQDEKKHKSKFFLPKIPLSTTMSMHRV